MKFRSFLIAFAALLVACGNAVAQDAPSPYMTDEEHAELIQLLNESMDMMMGLITGLTEEQWTFKQNPNRWSVGECAEHIVRSERALLDWTLEALAKEPDKDWIERTKGKADMIREGMPNRQPMGRDGATAPIEVRPNKGWGRAKTIAEFYKVRGEVRGFSDTLEGPIKSHTTEHPFDFFNWLNAHDWLIYIPLHTVRHSKQIIEVQEDADYPKEK